jgi:hypothetical protein
VLSALGAIAAGRTAYGIAQSKAIRYSEFGMALIPLTIASWLVLFAEFKVKKWINALPAMAVFLFIFFGYIDEWYFPTYFNHHGQKLIGKECVEKYLKQGGDSQCRFITSSPLKERLDNAKRYDMSFTRLHVE